MQILLSEQISDQMLIGGIDEVGLGPWAGPVTAAIVILGSKEITLLSKTNLNDSKQLSLIQRQSLDKLIKEIALDFKIIHIDHLRIDEVNILKATQEAMNQCFSALNIIPSKTFIDGRFFTPFQIDNYECIIDGDAKLVSVAAASVIAKVARDNLMIEYSKIYPGYGFEKHKGYGTKQHIEALIHLGPTTIHRKTFKPIRKYYALD